MSVLKIRTVSGNLVNEQISKQITENLLIDLKWMENRLEKRTFLVLLQSECDSASGNQDTWNDVKLLREVLVVHYLRDPNCGFIRFLSLKSGVEEERYSCGWQKELMKEAQSVLNEEAKRNGFLGITEIFSFVSVYSSAIKGWFPRCLYDSGFRLVETESLLQNISRKDHCNNSFLIYRPSLIPNYQVEDGALFDHVKTDVVLQFMKELLKFSDEYCDGINETENLQEYINRLEEKTWTMIAIRPSFPWHGTYSQHFCISSNFVSLQRVSTNLSYVVFSILGRRGPSPDDQVAVIGGGVAGLAAAASLREVGFDVVLLEAANYLGGRVKQVQPFKGFAPIDLGGEFIHGSNTVINRIAMKKHWLVQPCHRCEGMEKADQFYHKGKLFPLFSDQPDIQAAWKAWDDIVDFGAKILNAEQIRTTKNSPAGLIVENEVMNNKLLPSTNSDQAIVDAETKEGTFLAIGVERIADNHMIPLELDKDLTIMECLEKSQYSEDVIAVFDTMYCQTVGVSPYHMGLYESAREEEAWDYGYGNFRLTESYSQLVKYLVDKCTEVDKRLSWQVKEIFWKGDGIVKTGANADQRILITSQHGETLTAKYVVVTVPLTILKDGDISFVPDLPSDKKRAIDIIQMQGALKIVCRFRKRFWPDYVNLIYSVGGFLSQIWMYTRDSANSNDKCYLVAGFLTAEPAEEKVDLSGNDVLDSFLKQLDEMFGTEESPCPASQMFMDHVYYHWSKNPFVRGGYSSPTVHAYRLREDLARSLDHRLFFAGEATSVKTCATVHTAIETGLRAAGEICAESGKTVRAPLTVV